MFSFFEKVSDKNLLGIAGIGKAIKVNEPMTCEIKLWAIIKSLGHQVK